MRSQSRNELKLFGLLVALISLAGLSCQEAMAKPLFVEAGDQVGQATGIVVKDRCLVYFPKHILNDAPSKTLRLFDEEGIPVWADVIAQDQDLDLGLAELKATKGASCLDWQDEWLPTSESELAESLNSDRGYGLYIKSVSQRAGGIDLVPAPISSYNSVSKVLRLQTNEVLEQGVSGAVVYLSSRPIGSGRPRVGSGASTPRYELARNARPVAMVTHVDVETGEAIAPMLDFVLQDFIYATLSPIDLPAISIEPADVTATGRYRGRAAYIANSTPPSNNFDFVSFKLDLGDRDRIVTGLKMRFSRPLPQKTLDEFLVSSKISGRVPVELFGSMYRPGETENQRSQYCRSRGERCWLSWISCSGREDLSSQSEFVCQIEPRVLRGLWVDLYGLNPYLEAIEVLSE